MRGNFPTGHSTPAGFVGSNMPQADSPPAKRGRPPQDTAERLAAAHARVAAAADDAELHLAHAALKRAQRAHAATLGQPPPKYRHGRPPTGKPRRKGRSGKGGKMPALEGAARDERTRLLDLALAKCHADRGTPTSGTSWAELARTLSVHPSDLRAGRRSPALDRRLREYVGEACE